MIYGHVNVSRMQSQNAALARISVNRKYLAKYDLAHGAAHIHLGFRMIKPLRAIVCQSGFDILESGLSEVV